MTRGPNAEQLGMWPTTPGAESELSLVLFTERLPTGHLRTSYNIGAFHSTAGPLALSTGPFGPFTPPSTVGGAVQRLVRHWWDVSHLPRCDDSSQDDSGSNRLLQPFYEHLRLRGSL
jgi:hypothetical protein